jgi:hypothetical protein
MLGPQAEISRRARRPGCGGRVKMEEEQGKRGAQLHSLLLIPLYQTARFSMREGYQQASTLSL